MAEIHWTNSAIECYQSGAKCSECTIFPILGYKCRMKQSIIKLTRILGKPPIEDKSKILCEKGEEIMFDKDLKIEYPNFMTSTIDALKKGYSSYGELEDVTGIKKERLSVYINEIFKKFAKDGLVNPNNDKSRRIVVFDFIQTRLVNPDYKEEIKPAEPLTEKPVSTGKRIKKSIELADKIKKAKEPKEELLVNEPLTESEQKVLDLLLEGLTANEVAEKLIVSVTTVKTHITSIYQKRNYHSMPELIRNELKKQNEILQAKVNELENKQEPTINFKAMKDSINIQINKLYNKLELIETFEKEFNI